MMALDPLGERRIGRAHQLLVVLDEVDAGVDEFAHQLRRLVGRKAERRLDDGADDRAAAHAGQPARAFHAVLRAGMRAGEGRRQFQPDDADAATARDGIGPADADRHQRREICADGLDRKADLGIRRGCRAARGGVRLREGRDGQRLEIGRQSTRAATRAFSSAVSPGTGTNVPVDWSLAIFSAIGAGSPAVSIR